MDRTQLESAEAVMSVQLQLQRAAWRWAQFLLCPRAPSSYSALWMAHRLGLLVAIGYVVLDAMRLCSFEPEADLAAESAGEGFGTRGSHWQLLMAEDGALLLLALLYVVDALLYAYSHACDLPWEQLSPSLELPSLKHPTPARKVSAGGGVPPLEIALMSPSHPRRVHSHADAAAPSCAPGVGVPRPRPRRRIPLTLRTLRVVFLGSTDGIAEFLNLLGALGYLITAVFPFLFFVVSERTEQMLDKTGNVLDNFSMFIFVVDSFLYYRIAQRRKAEEWLDNAKNSPPLPQEEEEEGNEAEGEGGEEETHGLLARSHHHHQHHHHIHHVDQRRSSVDDEGDGDGNGDGDGDKDAWTVQVTDEGPSSLSTAPPPRRAAPSLSSRCALSCLDWELWGNVMNIIGGLVYLASTLYGFVVRMQATEELEKLQEQAEAAAAASGGTGANGLPLPFVPSWELEIEQRFHEQQLVAFVGDVFYMLCAVCMELSYEHEESPQPTSKHGAMQQTQTQMHAKRMEGGWASGPSNEGASLLHEDELLLLHQSDSGGEHT